jgi:hypothetical protein
MFRKRSLGLALLLSAAIGILIPGSVHATAIATSQISFSNLQIISDSGRNFVSASKPGLVLPVGAFFMGQNKEIKKA